MDSKHFLRTAEAPAFTPKGAIGWELGPLDGLSCYLRCVEAVLRAHGMDQRRVVNALLQPLDLLRKRSTSSGFHASSVEWSHDGSFNWELIQAALAAGEPLILMPDMFYWPGHKFENERHLFDHMVLLTQTDGSSLQMLDTDAPPAASFVRTLPVTPSLLQSLVRVGRVKVDFDAPFLSPAEVMSKMVHPQLDVLKEAIQDLQSLSERWNNGTISEVLARSFHVICLGDIQPQLRLLSIALSGVEADPLSQVFGVAAKRAMQLGLALLAEHQSVRGEPYALSKLRLKALVESLQQITGTSPSFESTPRSTHLEQRLAGLASYCYGI